MHSFLAGNRCSSFSARCCAQLGIAVSSIGPNSGSCLDKLHRYPDIAELIDTDAETTPCDP